MKKYEIAMIMQSGLTEEQVAETIEKMKNIYTNNGCKVDEDVQVGLKELAYTIKNKHNSGYYHYMIVEANHETNQEFERICRINSENIIRFMVTNVDTVAGSTLDTIRS